MPETEQQPNPDLPQPVDDLSEDAKLLWYEIVGRRANSPERLALLEVALTALDRAEEAADISKADGLTKTTESTGAVHAQPLLKVERENRGQFLTAWSHLQLDSDPYVDKVQRAH